MMHLLLQLYLLGSKALVCLKGGTVHRRRVWIEESSPIPPQHPKVYQNVRSEGLASVAAACIFV